MDALERYDEELVAIDKALGLDSYSVLAQIIREFALETLDSHNKTRKC
ncbi:MAG: hypothetical protein H0X50_06645 [Nitrosopumilus sp.]|nr:hypothetical protein [Nitrosopumilus sp.]